MKTPLATACAGLACLGLWVGASACAQNYYDNVVIVLDASGSMKDPLPGSNVQKMAAAKTALKTVLQQVPASTRVGLLVFSARNLRDEWVYPLGPQQPEELLKAIDLPEPQGSTPLGKYLKLGADRLLDERAKQFGYGTYRLLVVTDGEAQDQNLVDRYAPDVMSRGITLDVIGVGMRTDHTLATRVHSYRRANDPEALQRAVAEVLAEVSRPKNDQAMGEGFDLIAPIPVEVASAAITALATSGNHPIGERPRAAAPAAPAGEPTQATSAASPQAPSTSPPAPAGPTRGGRSFAFWTIVILFAAVFLLRRLGRGSRR